MTFKTFGQNDMFRDCRRTLVKPGLVLSKKRRFQLGTGKPTKTIEFSEKFQTAFNPPSFSENHIADFATKLHMFIMAVPLCII